MAAGEVVKRETFWGLREGTYGDGKNGRGWLKEDRNLGWAGTGKRKRFKTRDKAEKVARAYCSDETYVRPFTVVTRKKVKETFEAVVTSRNGWLKYGQEMSTLRQWAQIRDDDHPEKVGAWLKAHEGEEIVIKLTVKKK